MRKRKGGLIKKIENFMVSDFMLGMGLGVTLALNILTGMGYLN